MRGLKDKLRDLTDYVRRGMGAPRRKVDGGEYLKKDGGLKGGLEMKNTSRWLNRPREKRKMRLRFQVGNLDLPERRNRYTSSRVEQEVDAQNCSYGKAIYGEQSLYIGRT